MIGVHTSNSPKPGFWRVMGFVDGENLVFNYQSIMKTGKKPNANNSYKEDTYVWNKNTIRFRQFEILRATYYTYAVGSNEVVEKVNDSIRSFSFITDISSVLPRNLTPCVFKKAKKGIKTKGVDIKMTVDILGHTFNNNLDIVLLIAGDGDYLPVIKEVRRHGKQVFLAFFETGLNKNLLKYVDLFIPLDSIYFSK